MDDESKQMLREILDLQKKELRLLETYLAPPWYLRRWHVPQFSLRTLLIAITLVAAGLGFLAILWRLNH